MREEQESLLIKFHIFRTSVLLFQSSKTFLSSVRVPCFFVLCELNYIATLVGLKRQKMGWVGLGPQAAHNNAKLFFEDIWKLEDIWKFEDISKLEDISNAKELFSETCFWQFYAICGFWPRLISRSFYVKCNTLSLTKYKFTIHFPSSSCDKFWMATFGQ